MQSDSASCARADQHLEPLNFKKFTMLTRTEGGAWEGDSQWFYAMVCVNAALFQRTGAAGARFPRLDFGIDNRGSIVGLGWVKYSTLNNSRGFRPT